MKLTSFTRSKVRTDLLNSSTVHPYHGDFSPPSLQYILFQPCSHLRGGHRISLNARSLRIQFTLYEFPVTVMALSDYTQKAPFPSEKRARDCKVNVVYVRSKSKNNFYLKWRLSLSLLKILELGLSEVLCRDGSSDLSWWLLGFNVSVHLVVDIPWNIG